MDELEERTLGEKSSHPLLKLPFEPHVQKIIKSDQAHYLHSSAPSFIQGPMSSCKVKCIQTFSYLVQTTIPICHCRIFYTPLSSTC